MEQPVIENGTTRIDSFGQPAALRFPAHVISVVFHPLFIPIYVCLFLMFWHPLVFAGITPQGKVRFLASIFVNLTLLPAAAVFLLWRLKFIDNIYLRTQRERIIPYAVTMVFSFWAWNVFRQIPAAPPLFVDFLFGTFIAVIAAWMANIYFKISMHGLAVGGMLMFTILVSLYADGSTGQYIAAALLIAGVVCTARLIVSDHKPAEVYSGLVLGALSQYISHLF